MNRSWAACALAALACSGCASAPVHYYSLTPAAVPSSKSTVSVCCMVEMKTVRIPVEVDRPELVARRSDQELDLLANDLWLAPLRDEIKSALRDRIGRGLSDAPRLDAAPLGAAPLNPAPPTRVSVLVDVRRFESVPARHALIQAQWRLELANPPKTAVPAVCDATVSIDVGDGVSALVLGHQQAIAAIADRIAAQILDLRRTGESHCLV